ncbi:MAG: iron transporter [Oscillospiraceae bacterium]|nr:iron transporter [Oscillospiraceae bacterium]
MKKLLALTLAALLLAAVLTGCASAPAEPPAADSQPTQTEQPTAEEPAAEQPAAEEPPAAEEEPAAEEPALADGVYTADFDTDSSMFHANEACDGKGTLTVQDGEMTIHVSLVSKTILNLFPGLAEDAQKDGAVLLQPTTDTVTYSDGLSEEVYGFDIPVPALDTEFDLALIGKKGVWYDHKVSVSNPEPLEPAGKTAQDLGLADGSYTAEVAFSGGSGKSHIESPVTLTVKDGAVTAAVVWSSSKYDYMIVDGERCDVLTTEPGSTFEIPVAAFDTDLTVIGDTTAMSTPHEIEYTLNFASATLTPAG